MLSIDWHSPAAYRFARSIPGAGFTWEYLRRDDEYLRRDDEYRREFSAITASTELGPKRLEAVNPVRSADFILEPIPPAAVHTAHAAGAP